MKATRANLFQNGGGQAVQLPKACRFAAQSEVLARREGRRVILEAADEWSDKFRACLGAWSGEIPRPKQRQVRETGRGPSARSRSRNCASAPRRGDRGSFTA